VPEGCRAAPASSIQWFLVVCAESAIWTKNTLHTNMEDVCLILYTNHAAFHRLQERVGLELSGPVYHIRSEKCQPVAEIAGLLA
jgi:hypothetical protein